MVEAAAARADDEHPAGREAGRDVEGELEIGGVLRRGVPLYRRTLRLRGGEPVRRDGVEVADRDMDGSPRARARSMPPSAAITVAAAGRPIGNSSAEGAPAATTITSCMRSSAGITQIRFCGSAAHHVRPLSPVVPSSPDSLRPILAGGVFKRLLSSRSRGPVRSPFFLGHEDLHRQAGRDSARLVSSSTPRARPWAVSRPRSPTRCAARGSRSTPRTSTRATS